MQIYLITNQKSNISSYFNELKIEHKQILAKELSSIKSPDIVFIDKEDKNAANIISLLRKTNLDTYIIHIYSQQDKLSNIINNGADDYCHCDSFSLEIFKTRIKSWIEITKARKNANKLEVDGKNLFGATVWDLRTRIVLKDNKSIELLWEHLLNNKRFYELQNSDIWLNFCLNLATKLIAFELPDYPVLILEENDDFLIMSIKHLPTKNKDFYYSLTESSDILKYNFIGFMFKKTKGVMSFYFKKRQKINVQATDKVKSSLNERDIATLKGLETDLKAHLMQAFSLEEQLSMYGFFFSAYADVIQQFDNINQIAIAIQNVANLVASLKLQDEITQENALMFASLIANDMNLWKKQICESSNSQTCNYVDKAIVANCTQFENLLRLSTNTEAA